MILSIYSSFPIDITADSRKKQKWSSFETNEKLYWPHRNSNLDRLRNYRKIIRFSGVARVRTIIVHWNQPFNMRLSIDERLTFTAKSKIVSEDDHISLQRYRTEPKCQDDTKHCRLRSENLTVSTALQSLSTAKFHWISIPFPPLIIHSQNMPFTRHN